jgi:hypothetical protein
MAEHPDYTNLRKYLLGVASAYIEMCKNPGTWYSDTIRGCQPRVSLGDKLPCWILNSSVGSMWALRNRSLDTPHFLRWWDGNHLATGRVSDETVPLGPLGTKEGADDLVDRSPLSMPKSRPLVPSCQGGCVAWFWRRLAIVEDSSESWCQPEISSSRPTGNRRRGRLWLAKQTPQKWAHFCLGHQGQPSQYGWPSTIIHRRKPHQHVKICTRGGLLLLLSEFLTSQL